MNYRLLKKYILLFVIPILIACVDQTNSLVVFENNIGVPNGTLGLYSMNKKDGNAELSLCYRDSKYYMIYVVNVVRNK